MQLGGARLLGEAHCAAPVRSKSTALRLRTAGGNERSALKSSAVRCENRPQCGEIERSAHGKRPHCAPHCRSAHCANCALSGRTALRSARSAPSLLAVRAALRAVAMSFPPLLG